VTTITFWSFSERKGLRAMAGDGRTVTQYICEDRHIAFLGSMLWFHRTVVVPGGGAVSSSCDLGPLNGGPIFR
jgi:hypothetical protein